MIKPSSNICTGIFADTCYFFDLMWQHVQSIKQMKADWWCASFKLWKWDDVDNIVQLSSNSSLMGRISKIKVATSSTTEDSKATGNKDMIC